MKIIFLIICVLVSLTAQQGEASLSSAKDFLKIPGTQVYLYETTTSFSYISVDSSVTDKLKATVYHYVNVNLADVSSGLYAAFGFGGQVMNGSDMVLCAATKDSKMWCKDYDGKSRGIELSTTLKTKLISSSVKTLNDSWAPYKTVMVWEIERVMDPKKIIDGKEEMISAYGELTDPNTPAVEQHTYFNIPKLVEFKSSSSSEFVRLSCLLIICLLILIN